MIRIKKLYPRRFAWLYNPDTKVLLIGLYWFTIGIDFGLKNSRWYKHFFRSCPVCKEPLNVLSFYQIVKFHKRCRKEGRRLERLKRLKLKNV